MTLTNHGAKIHIEKNNITDVKKQEEKFISLVNRKGDFVADVDGYVYFYSNNGILSSHHLRWIADELDKRNKEWDNAINEYFKNETR